MVRAESLGQAIIGESHRALTRPCSRGRQAVASGFARMRQTCSAGTTTAGCGEVGTVVSRIADRLSPSPPLALVRAHFVQSSQ